MRVSPRKVAYGAVALLLFTLALELMKAGAGAGVGPFLRGTLGVDSWWNALGAGWILAALALSGSPIAAMSLTLLAADALRPLEAYFMVSGSRLGAAFIVLLVGFLYHLRGHKRTTSLGMGVVSLLVTVLVYGPAMVVGWLLLTSGWFDGVRLGTPGPLRGAIDLLFGVPVGWLAERLPFGLLFLLGVGVVIGSLQLFDRALPSLRAKDLRVRNLADLVYKPWVMFVVGLAVTALTLSVSVSLSILVPLTVKGIIRRENVIPYIMGANVTTFVDTLVAALLIGDPRAFTVLLVQMVAVIVVSAAVLLVRYESFETFVLRSMRTILDGNARLVTFLVAFLAVPLVLALL